MLIDSLFRKASAFIHFLNVTYQNGADKKCLQLQNMIVVIFRILCIFLIFFYYFNYHIFWDFPFYLLPKSLWRKDVNFIKKTINKVFFPNARNLNDYSILHLRSIIKNTYDWGISKSTSAAPTKTGLKGPAEIIQSWGQKSYYLQIPTSASTAARQSSPSSAIPSSATASAPILASTSVRAPDAGPAATHPRWKFTTPGNSGCLWQR